MKRLLTICFLIPSFTLLFSSCKKSIDEPIPITPSEKTIYGSAQKGPFINGSFVTIYELGDNYTQTGKSYSTQINDNSGGFQLNNISLASNYVQLRVDGFYFNEICGSNSISQITLNCIAEIENVASLRINLLTHLEKSRVEYLISTGFSFINAKKQAQKDVLSIFNITAPTIENSENLDISQSGEGNAILLAISSILQGFRTESELSSLLSTISSDIRIDGILNDANIKSSLIDHALLLDTISIRNNVTNLYTNLGINASIPDFEDYISHFITNTSFTPNNNLFSYPSSGSYGDNILFKTQLIYSGTNFSFAADRLKNCSTLKIKLQKISGITIGNNVSTQNNLNISMDTYTVIDPSLPFSHNVAFLGPGTTVYLVEYFENNSSTPTFSKTITIN